ncbi:aminotransferase class V-fold PLP-dependent enzyme [Amycolatopsis sp. NPDC059027]|uniref:aminotransferase class V-fold PLP-dependent enzyme n=1 Tax=Amycolatopsis sp. NPDC059027 TaxID=3346709 RepID=UPI00366B8D07
MSAVAQAHRSEGLEETTWRALRREFRLDPSRLHLANFFLASPPTSVRAAADHWRALLDFDPHLLESFLLGDLAELGSGIASDSPYFQAKTAIAGYLGAPAEEVAFVPSTTTGLALIYNGLSIPADAEMVITPDAHYSLHQAVHRAAEKNRAAVRRCSLYHDPAHTTREEILDRVRAALTPRTRCLGLTWVSSRTGVKLPLPEIAALVADANRDRDEASRCLLIVDGVQGFGAEDHETARLGSDFFIAGAHKWFLGPAGTGVVHGRAQAWRQIAPTIPSFEIDTTLHTCWLGDRPLPATRASFVAPGGFTDYANIFALTDTVRFHQRIGRSAIAARIRELNTRLRHELAGTPGIRLLTPTDPAMASGLVCFQIPGRTAATVVAALATHGIKAATSPYEEETIRMGAGIINNHDEIEHAVATLRGQSRLPGVTALPSC